MSLYECDNIKANSFEWTSRQTHAIDFEVSLVIYYVFFRLQIKLTIDFYHELVNKKRIFLCLLGDSGAHNTKPGSVSR